LCQPILALGGFETTSIDHETKRGHLSTKCHARGASVAQHVWIIINTFGWLKGSYKIKYFNTGRNVLKFARTIKFQLIEKMYE